VGEGTLVCSNVSAPGEVTGLKTGTLEIAFTGCEFAGLKCKTTGAKADEIYAPVEFTIVYAAKSGVETAATLITPKSPIKIECGGRRNWKSKGNS
jgi:hypothetical protein